MDISLLIIAYSRFNVVEKNLNNLDLTLFKKIYLNIDGPKTNQIKSKQLTFIKKVNSLKIGNLEISINQTNIGVRNFVVQSISSSFKDSNFLLVLEDDILINNKSIQFILSNKDILNKNIISLFNPINLKNNILTFDGGIWGWSVSKENWQKFHWVNDSYFTIFCNVYNCQGLLKSLYYSPLICLSSRGLIKSWAYTWYYIRLIQNIKSLVPFERLSVNTGIGDLHASNSIRNHKFSNLKLSNNLKQSFKNHSIPLTILSGFSFPNIILRIIYNNLRFIFLKK